ncbi:Hypothetical predicted protein [Cloeon dipterum]|uniref:Protein kinase domain-containing protein n=1 Tax=Cloeon dipterum TaxID=197152 RepID=A0A8S1E601_9INSE|nr:Hypothetical predicted protein [Cloeon dipterum]
MCAAASAIRLEERDEIETISPHFNSTKYELRSLIAAGSFAKVFVAKHKQMNLLVAMKKGTLAGGIILSINKKP